MELSQEKKTQIAACHGKGMTVKEIAKTANLTEAQVDVFLQSIGKKPLYRSTQSRDVTRRYRRVTEEQKEQMQKMLDEGKTVYTIAKELDIDIKTVKKYTNSKEKEPATAATVTDSEVKHEKENAGTNSFSNNTIGTAKSQAILKRLAKEFLDIYERLDESHQHAWDLGELYAQIKEGIGE